MQAVPRTAFWLKSPEAAQRLHVFVSMYFVFVFFPRDIQFAHGDSWRASVHAMAAGIRFSSASRLRASTCSTGTCPDMP